MSAGHASVPRTILLAAERIALSGPVEWAGLLSSELVQSSINQSVLFCSDQAQAIARGMAGARLEMSTL